ncbi:Ger(x)C family spore germination protein [Neobacillus mesonae]|nr:Ger(x)C family spore germination protein [Neobacillus mesonae]
MRKKTSLLRGIFKIILILTVVFQLTGCWSSVELNRRAFVRIMMVDRTDQGVEVTLGYPLPNRIPSGGTDGGSGGGNSQEPFTYTSKISPSIGEAYRKIQADLPRGITLGQLRNFIIGKRFAENKEDMIALSDFLTREPYIHINGNMFVTVTPAKHFARIPAIFERFPSVILTNYVRHKNTLNVTVKDMLIALYAGGDFLLPQLVFSEVTPAGKTSKGDWLGTGGTGVFAKGRMVGTLNTDQTFAVRWLFQKERSIEYNINSPIDGKKVSFLLSSSKSDIKPIVEGDEIRFVTFCEIKASVIASESTIDLADPQQVSRLEEEVDSTLQTKLTQSFRQFKEMKSDPLQLGSHLKWHYPGTWRKVKNNWRETLAADVTIQPMIETTIDLSGAVKRQNWDQYLSGSAEDN